MPVIGPDFLFPEVLGRAQMCSVSGAQVQASRRSTDEESYPPQQAVGYRYQGPEAGIDVFQERA